MSKFDQGAHSVSAAQIGYFNDMRTAECEAQFYGAVYAYARSETAAIDLRGNCTPLRLTDPQMTIRQNLMNSITLYADALQALSATGDDKQLDTNAQNLAAKINGLAKSGGFAVSGVGADVEAAIVGLTGMVIDNKKFTEVRDAAISQQENLSSVIDALKKENSEDAVGIDSSLSNIRDELTTILATERGQRGTAVFFDVIQSRDILLAVNPLDNKTGANLETAVQQLNDALDSLVAANQAIATSGNGGIIAAVNDLVVRAQQAQLIQAALSK